MKTIVYPHIRLIRNSVSGIFCLVLMLISSCNKDVSEPEINLPALRPANLETSGGSWRTAVLTDVKSVTVAEPLAITSAEYARELEDLKKLRANLTAEQSAAVTYWSGGGVLRWNQIMRDLVAKYNLPPVANADGTYGIPDATNPFSYPQFPFSNPPYAARAYAYVSIAQYDALVAAWHYKYQYNRVAPYHADKSLNPLVPASDLPAYPSEDAVIASVTLELMKFLFPAEVDFLNRKAQEQKDARLWAGANVASDLAAGDELGKQVAQQILARARTDGMRNAVGDKAIWDGLAESAISRGETPWISLETPHRPPMLPVFGKVRPCLFDASEIAAMRPPPPPSTHSEQMKKELEEVKYFTENVTRERLRIVHFWADGVGTYTPPGHWNQIAAGHIIAQHWSEIRTARAFALLNMALMDAAICCWDAKNFYFNPRPSQLDPSIKTSTGVPNFPAYTSGHSTFSGAAATVLGYLFPAEAKNFDDMAQEASLSRLYGGIHYRSDCEMGLKSGRKIGEMAINWGKNDGSPQ